MGKCLSSPAALVVYIPLEASPIRPFGQVTIATVHLRGRTWDTATHRGDREPVTWVTERETVTQRQRRLKRGYTDPHLTRARCVYVCACVRGDVCRDNNTLYITWREITFPGISMSHCAKCHQVPVKGCLLNCHNFFNGEYHERWAALAQGPYFSPVYRILWISGVALWYIDPVANRSGHGARLVPPKRVMEGERSRKTLDSDLYRPCLILLWDNLTWPSVESRSLRFDR